jgi:ADP-ribosylglycohydrolase
MRLDGRDQGYTILTTKVAFAALEQYYDFEDGIIAVINKGGDADTNAAVAGALLAARGGTAELPPEWADGLVGRERVVRAAEGLLELASR